jgi:hypothetical protein
MKDRRKGSDKSVGNAPAALLELLAEIPVTIRKRIVQELETALEEQKQRERDRCVRLCKHRASLWRNTSASRSSLESAREEARARANEAVYLADVLASGEDASEFTVGGDADA